MNWRTTLTGVLAAAAQGIKAAYPEWGPVLDGLTWVLVAALGYLAKDAAAK